MNIEALGEKIISHLFNEKLVCCFSDIYKLKKEKLEVLPGFGEKLASNIIQNIEQSKKCRLSCFIFSLGIRHVGEQLALKLSEAFGENKRGLKSLLKADEEDLIQIENVGQVVAQSIVMELKQMRNEIDKLFKMGVRVVPRKKSHHSSIEGRLFVVTGRFSKKREEIEQLIQSYGGETSSSVSSKTDYLLFGQDSGSKYTKAKKLGIKLINFKQFEKLANS